MSEAELIEQGEHKVCYRYRGKIFVFNPTNQDSEDKRGEKDQSSENTSSQDSSSQTSKQADLNKSLLSSG